MIDRGPGGSEPAMIRERMDAGLTFDDAVAEIEQLHGFRCESWWKDLNRPLFNAEPDEKPTKGKK